MLLKNKKRPIKDKKRLFRMFFKHWGSHKNLAHKSPGSGTPNNNLCASSVSCWLFVYFCAAKFYTTILLSWQATALSR